jgi:hypothetical protein
MESALFFLVFILFAGGLATWGIWFPILVSILGLGGSAGFATTVVQRERDKDVHDVTEATLMNYTVRNHVDGQVRKVYDPNEHDHQAGGH